MKAVSAVILLVLLAFTVVSCDLVRNTEAPARGYVPDAETAKRIAEAVWVPIYGTEEIDSQKPFQVQFVKGIWIVQGVLHNENTNYIVVGGTAHVEIAQKDGRILKVSHGE